MGEVRFQEIIQDSSSSYEKETTPYVTTPTMKRRVQSQRISREERPNVIPYGRAEDERYSSDEEETSYTVVEPEEDPEEVVRIHSSPDIYEFDVDRQQRRSLSHLEREKLPETDYEVEESISKGTAVEAEAIIATSSKKSIDPTVDAQKLVKKFTEKSEDEIRIPDISIEISKSGLEEKLVDISAETATVEINAPDQTEPSLDSTEEKAFESQLVDIIDQEESGYDSVKAQNEVSQVELISSEETLKIDSDQAQEVSITDSSNAAEITISADSLQPESKTDLEKSVSEAATSSGLGESERVTDRDEIENGATVETQDEFAESDSKPRVLFHIESEEDLQSDIECDLPVPVLDSSSSTEEFVEKVKQDLKATLEREQLILEEKLSAMKSRIFDDMSDESLTKTKELVDERLRKISDNRCQKEAEVEVVAPIKEKSPARSDTVDEIKIGRFHVTPALVEDIELTEEKEKIIADRLRSEHKDEETKEELEKELPEKLTEADFEEVMKELKMEGLKADMYLQLEDDEKEEKKEKTLKRVERRFERMASETLEKEKEDDNGELDKQINLINFYKTSL